jgi:hypothetical protein
VNELFATTVRRTPYGEAFQDASGFVLLGEKIVRENLIEYCPKCNATLLATSATYISCPDCRAGLYQNPMKFSRDLRGKELRKYDRRLRTIFGPSPVRLAQTDAMFWHREQVLVAKNVPDQMRVTFELGNDAGMRVTFCEPPPFDHTAETAAQRVTELSKIRLCRCNGVQKFLKEESTMTGKEACEKLAERFDKFKVQVQIDYHKCGECGKPEPKTQVKVVIPDADVRPGRSYKDDKEFVGDTIEEVVTVAVLWNASPLKGTQIEEVDEALK